MTIWRGAPSLAIVASTAHRGALRNERTGSINSRPSATSSEAISLYQRVTAASRLRAPRSPAVAPEDLYMPGGLTGSRPRIGESSVREQPVVRGPEIAQACVKPGAWVLGDKAEQAGLVRGRQIFECVVHVDQSAVPTCGAALDGLNRDVTAVGGDVVDFVAVGEPDLDRCAAVDGGASVDPSCARGEFRAQVRDVLRHVRL